MDVKKPKLNGSWLCGTVLIWLSVYATDFLNVISLVLQKRLKEMTEQNRSARNRILREQMEVLNHNIILKHIIILAQFES